MTGQYGPDDLNELIGEARFQQVRGAAGTDRLIGQPWRINCRKNHHRNALGLRIGLQQPADFPTGDIRETQIQYDRVWLTCSCQADPVASGIRGDDFEASGFEAQLVHLHLFRFVVDEEHERRRRHRWTLVDCLNRR